MKIQKTVVGILLVSFLACNNSKKVELNSLPKEEFGIPDVSNCNTFEHTICVNDLEHLFTTDQNEKLERYLLDLEKKTGPKILILTVPSKEKSTKDWSIEHGFTSNGILITISKSLKIVGIGVSKEEQVLSESIRTAIIQNTVIPEFNRENYYLGTKKGIDKIIQYSK